MEIIFNYLYFLFLWINSPCHCGDIPLRRGTWFSGEKYLNKENFSKAKKPGV
jgi:hypothetical protein